MRHGTLVKIYPKGSFAEVSIPAVKALIKQTIKTQIEESSLAMPMLSYTSPWIPMLSSWQSAPASVMGTSTSTGTVSSTTGGSVSSSTAAVDAGAGVSSRRGFLAAGLGLNETGDAMGWAAMAKPITESLELLQQLQL